MEDSDAKLREKIINLKKRRNAIILAHNYQLGEVQDIADFVGDSLELSAKLLGTRFLIICILSLEVVDSQLSWIITFPPPSCTFIAW